MYIYIYFLLNTYLMMIWFSHFCSGEYRILKKIKNKNKTNSIPCDYIEHIHVSSVLTISKQI